LFVHVVTCRARGVTKGVHYIAFLAGAHQNDNFNFEKLFSNCLIMFEHTRHDLIDVLGLSRSDV
jgi:hypothetical protein